jgi:hypothetical protein
LFSGALASNTGGSIMRFSCTSLFLGLATAGLVAWTFASSASAGRPPNVKFPPKGERYSMGNLPQDKAKTGNHGDHGKPGHHAAQGHHQKHHGHKRFRHPYYHYGHHGLILHPQYHYYPRYDYVYPYPVYPGPRYYLGPLHLPAETMYGPEAVKRFMGVDQTRRPPAEPNVVIEPKIIIPPGDDKNDNEDDFNLRGTNRQALALAWRFIGFGDAQFADQQYREAQQRYRKATQAAPRMAEGHFREGYAYMAMERYDLAADSLKRALELDDDLPESDFTNDELYGDNQLAKKAHLDALAKVADENRHESDLFFLLGVFHYFEGEEEQAADALEHAQRLLARDDDHIQAFLDAMK